ncbi:hypothetical protein OSB04_027164 [Centaurea solstitialis]|uniref:TF-B3 domain-containing protein n=1 Tax=Centaurea solstitialis TaxID=347529 RepID=A0AA38SE35_9ASTR|nr:hypothetical protein OSB04_027164 [Centaurea solstitialis]
MKSQPTSNFIRLIVSHDTGSTGIRIPNKFIEKHGNELLDKVMIKLPNADVWQLRLTKSTTDGIWLKNGWSEFADHYGLRFGHLLMFTYQGSSIFCVTIFSANGSEILYPPPTKTDQPTIPTKQVKLEDDEDQKHNLNINNDVGECSRKQRLEDTKRALKRAKLNFKSHKPFFMVYMNQNHVTRKSGPSVPGGFRKKHWRDSENHTKYVLQLAKKHGTPKTWEVAVHNAYFMVAGWMKFVEQNGIAAGDICVFELIHKHQNVLAVTILRS